MGLRLRRLRLLVRGRTRSLRRRGLSRRLRVDGLCGLLLWCLMRCLLGLRLRLLRSALGLLALLLLLLRLLLGLLLSLLLGLLLLSLLLSLLLLGLLLLHCHLGLLKALHVLRVHLHRLARLLLALLHLLILLSDGLLLESDLLSEHRLCLGVMLLRPHALPHGRDLSCVHRVHWHSHRHTIDARHIRVEGLLGHECLSRLLLLLEQALLRHLGGMRHRRWSLEITKLILLEHLVLGRIEMLQSVSVRTSSTRRHAAHQLIWINLTTRP